MKEKRRKRKTWLRVMSWVLVVAMTVGLIQGLSIAGVFEKLLKVQAGDGDIKRIYFDATLSKIPYSDKSATPNNLPGTSTPDVVWISVWNDTGSSERGTGWDHIQMTPYAEKKDVYYADVDVEKYHYIRFGSTEDAAAAGGAGEWKDGYVARDSASSLNASFNKPCFYADTAEIAVYEHTVIGGHWGELETGINTYAASKLDYASNGTEVKDVEKKYVTTTFYDYYSDWELKGTSRSDLSVNNVGPDGDGKYVPGFGYTNRTYMPSRVFNMVLSDYYKENKVVNPLYFGHFQWEKNSEGTYFDTIANDMNLYGYTSKDEFLYNNNSKYRYGIDINNTDNKNSVINNDVAVQGLVYNELSADGNLQLAGKNSDDSSKVVEAPYFNESFLSGNSSAGNTSNIAVGKVYDNVDFPFTKKGDYWEFDSADTSLRMKKDTTTSKYFLSETTDKVHGFTNGKFTDSSNFFPFNDASESGNVNKLNYGFGMKMQFDFTLTDSGQIYDSSNNLQDIVFTFRGDDDIWIFIDGKLALDLGGSHGAVEGKLNFKDLTSTVSAVKTTADAYSAGNATQTNVSSSFTLEGEKSDNHTLTMFYMERGLWESNMKITFNFPQNNIFTVDKTVKTDNLNDKIKSNATVLENLKNLPFDFAVSNLAVKYGTTTVATMNENIQRAGFVMPSASISDYGSYGGTTLKPVTGATYYIDEGTTLGTTGYVVSASGTISLTSGQKARFTNMFRRGSYISVTEQSSDKINGLYGSNVDISKIFDTKWSINENAVEGSTVSVRDNGRKEKEFDTALTDDFFTGNNTLLFRNYTGDIDSNTELVKVGVSYTNTFKTGSIVISKKQAESNTADLSAASTYIFKVTLDNIAGLHLEDVIGAGYTVTTDNKIVLDNIILKKGETSTVITGIPVGTEYTIEETVSDTSSVAYVKSGSTDVTLETGGKTVKGKVETTDTKTYDFYNAIPQYKAVYYKQVNISAATYAANTDKYKAVTVDGKVKYFEKDSETSLISAKTGDAIIYNETETSDRSGSVKLKEIGDSAYVVVSDTVKIIPTHQYSPKATFAANQYQDTVATGKIAEVDLYYELTSYTEKHYIETVPDPSWNPATDPDKYVTIDGVTYIKQEEEVKNHEINDTPVTVETKTGTPYNQYTPMDNPDPTNHPQTSTVNPDGSTIVYKFYSTKPAGYEVKYYVQVDKAVYDDENAKPAGSRTETDTVDGKYFILKTFVAKEAPDGHIIEYKYNSSSKEAGVKNNNLNQEVEGTYKRFDNYEFNDTTTKNKNEYRIAVDKNAAVTPVVKLYYERIIAQYQEEYYIQTDKKENTGTYIEKGGKIYKRQDGDTTTKTEKAGEEVTVADKQNDEPYKDYELVTIDGYPKTAEVKEDGTTIVYQVYGKQPALYTVEYYVQVDKTQYDNAAEADRDIATEAGKEKYFIKKTSLVRSATVGDAIEYTKDTAGAAGVKVTAVGTTDAIEAADTMKSFTSEGYEFKENTTKSANKRQYKDEVVKENTAVIRLYYEKMKVPYTEKYYLQIIADSSSDYSDNEKYIKTPDGRIYELQTKDTNIINDKEVGTEVTVTDKQKADPYINYKLVTIDGYPATAVVAADGSTVVYQIYERIPNYTVQYYKEVSESDYNKAAETDRVKQSGKFFVRAAVDVTNKAFNGDKVIYDVKDTKTAGVTLNGTKIDSEVKDTNNTYKNVKGYVFDETITKTAGAHEIVSVDYSGKNIVQLYYVLPEIDISVVNYTVRYYKQVSEAVYNATPENSRTKVGDKLFIIADDDVINTAEVNDSIKYNVRGEKAGVVCNSIAIDGSIIGEKDTYKAFENYVFNETTTQTAGNAEKTVKEDGSTVIELYYEKIPAKYSVEYWFQTDKTSYDKADGSKKKLVDGKYFVINDAETLTNLPAYINDSITYDSRKAAGADKTEAGILIKEFDIDSATDKGASVDKTYKSFDKYEYNAKTTLTAGSSTSIVNAEGTAVVRLFYEKELTSYTEKYYIEVFDKEDTTADYITVSSDGRTKIYKLEESNVVKNQESGKEATVTDKQNEKAYEDYMLNTSAAYKEAYPWTAVVADDGTTIVYQIYEKKPVYTVEYYTEIDKATYDKTPADMRDAVKAPDGSITYFLKQEAVIKTGGLNNSIKYATWNENGNTKAGVTITDNGSVSSVDDTYRSYYNFEFNPNTTENAMSYEDIINMGNDAVIKLYYESKITKYTEKYYIELSEEEAKNVTIDGENYVEITIKGVKKVFKRQDIEEHDYQKAGRLVEVNSKEGKDIYGQYELVTVTVDGYPADGIIDEDGSTVVYQIYIKKNVPDPIPTPVTTPDTPKSGTPVKTGDVADITLLVLLVASASTITVLAIRHKKKENE